MAKSNAHFSIETNVLEAARSAGINMSEVVENALRNAANFQGSPEEVKKFAEKKKVELVEQLKEVNEGLSKMDKSHADRERILADKDILYVLKSWKAGSATDSGLANTIKRKFGFIPNIKFLVELKDEATKRGLI